MRGKPPIITLPHPNTRNIPAYAGKTHQQPPWPPNAWEHPRVCGENHLPKIEGFAHVGTSPRMRGKLSDFTDEAIVVGNIPAYAGKTSALCALWTSAREHPRVCGENVTQTSGIPEFYGTSPRMRGKRPDVKPGIVQDRNIPAYAGKTAYPWAAMSPPPEHPRVCGENRCRVRQWTLVHGTSPRMRGKPGLLCLHQALSRNIPAYAGKTLG